MSERIGVAAICQETNTWSLVPCTLEDFEVQGLVTGQQVWDDFHDTGTEVGGALRAVAASGAAPVPLVRAWANSSGRLTASALARLQALLVDELARHAVDGLVLSLHGAMAADGVDDADAVLIEAAREAVGERVPIGVCLDLHANVTPRMVAAATFVVGFHTYPHTDLAQTGERAVRLVLDQVRGRRRPVTVVAKRPMIIPAEAMSTTDGPMGELRREADLATTGAVLDVSLFPVQPWLDVEGLGFGVAVTTDADPALAAHTAEVLADKAWDRRRDFTVELLTPVDAVSRARSATVRPFIISESADAPTAGAAGDSPAMVQALLDHGRGLEAYVTVTDPAAVEQCHAAGAGAIVELSVGAKIDRRFHHPVELRGTVGRLGDDPVLLTGPSYTGTEVSMGRYAVVRHGGLAVVLTERPAFTLDPAVFSHVGLRPEDADVIVVRSAMGFRAGYPAASSASAVLLDLPGASTPRLELLDFERAPRPLFPLDDVDALTAPRG